VSIETARGGLPSGYFFIYQSEKNHAKLKLQKFRVNYFFQRQTLKAKSLDGNTPRAMSTRLVFTKNYFVGDHTSFVARQHFCSWSRDPSKLEMLCHAATFELLSGNRIISRENAPQIISLL
jgi:hypothetical protein